MVLWGIYMNEGQPSSPRSRVSVKFFVKIYFRLYERIAIDYPRSRLYEGWKFSIQYKRI